MTHWYHHFWHMIVIAGILFAAIGIGGLGAGLLKLVNWTLSGIVANVDYKNSILDRLDMALYLFTKSCIRFFVKSAQWVGSVAILLLIVGGLGRFGIVTFMHWREIWGP